MIAVFRRERNALWHSAYGYVLTGGFLLILSLFVTLIHFAYGYAEFSQTLSYLTVGTALLLPVLSMALFSPSAKERGDGLLRMLPLSGNDIIFGKYMTALFVLGMATLGTAVCPLLLRMVGEVRLATAYAGILAFFLMEHALLSVCLYLASKVPNRPAAWCVTYGVIVGLWAIGRVAELLPQPLRQIANALSIFGMYTPFVFGMLDWRTVVLCLVVSVIFLILTVQNEQKKWLR